MSEGFYLLNMLLIVCVTFVAWAADRKGYKRGHDEGYRSGVADEAVRHSLKPPQ